MRRVCLARGGLLSVAVLLASAVVRAESAPLPDGDIMVMNLSPTALRAGWLEAPDPWAATPESWLRLEQASHFVVERTEVERLYLDGETTHWAVGVAGLLPAPRDGDGAAARNAWFLELSGVTHAAGRLDGFIDGFHAAFGFPDAGRDQVPRNALRFSARENRSGPWLTESVSDLRALTAGGSLALGAGATRLQLTAALPLGDPDRFTGAEDPSVSLGLSHAGTLGQHLYWGASLAGTYLGGTSFTADSRGLVQSRVTLGWRLTPRLHLRGQLDASSALSPSELGGHGDPVFQATVGVAARFLQRWGLELALAEDPSVDSAPDVIFQLRVVRWR
jgi:hypothetical protein